MGVAYSFTPLDRLIRSNRGLYVLIAGVESGKKVLVVNIVDYANSSSTRRGDKGIVETKGRRLRGVVVARDIS